jgi:vacuolar-type H+-ATPase subunit I/STV1
VAFKFEKFQIKVLFESQALDENVTMESWLIIGLFTVIFGVMVGGVVVPI